MEANDPIDEVKTLTQRGEIDAAQRLIDSLRETCESSPRDLHALVLLSDASDASDAIPSAHP